MPTIWVDAVSGVGVTDSGSAVTPRISARRKTPSLADLLDTAHAYGAARIMLIGDTPEPRPGSRHWLLVATPGWRANGHWLASPPTGRFVLDVEAEKPPSIEVRTAAEWFGAMELTPEQARRAWAATAAALAAAVPGAAMFLSPAATGTNTWVLSLPKTIDLTPIPGDVAEMLHASSGQHRIEQLAAGPDACDCGDCRTLFDFAGRKTIETFAYVDGRFMYGALGRELGTSPVQLLTRADCAHLVQTDPYARARFHVRFIVPSDWASIGLLGVQHANPNDGWHYPSRPGYAGTTWADAAEVHLALRYGWHVDFLEGVQFSKGRVLDTWTERLTRARTRAVESPDPDPVVARAVAAALRAVLIQGIGAFASRGRARTEVVTNARMVPAEYAATMVRHGDVFAYTVAAALSGRNAGFYRPELAVQVWGRGRARVLEGPSTLGPRSAGALHVDPVTLLGINGDALYTSHVPTWSLPEAHGGGDDGRVGRLRLQGVLSGRVRVPDNRDSRNKLRARAAAAGISAYLAGDTGDTGDGTSAAAADVAPAQA